jgi:hypothetical protein
VKIKLTVSGVAALLGAMLAVAFFVFLLTLPPPAHAQERTQPVGPDMHFLVLLGLLDKNVRPIVQATLPDADDCWKAARRANSDDPRMQMPDWKEAGARYVCMRIVPEML